MKVLADRYTLEEPRGGGGMGSVYTASDERLGRKVAIKIMHTSLASDPRFVERFRREARAAASLAHPNIAAVYDYGEEDGSGFIVMELVEGQDLAQILRDEGPLDPDRVVTIARQIAAALGHAHEAGVVHRDVKPGNVLLDANDRVKMTDFGIARATGDNSLTASGVIMGTVHYISPEQASGTTAGPPSDVYSLGIVMYEMLTGSVPFTADTPIGVAMRHLDEEVPPPSSAAAEVPTELDEIVRIATAKAPETRFRDGAAMEAALAGGALQIPVTAGSRGVELTRQERAVAETTVIGPWSPARFGKVAGVVLGALATVALVLALIRVSDGSDPTAGERPRGAPEARESQAGETDADPTPEESPEETTEPVGYEVPELVGDNLKDWRNVLKQAGLRVEQVRVDDDAPKDTILEVDPAPGSIVQSGDTVTLTTSTGKGSEEEDEEDD